MSESIQSRNFIKKNKEQYGNILYIEKVINPLKTGEPDIHAIYKGMTIYAESKLLHQPSYKNTHPFTEIQLYNLAIKAKAGAICIGLLFCGKEVKYLIHNQLKEYLNKQDWEKGELFDWETLRSNWLKTIIDF